MTEFKLQRLGVVMEPESGNPQEVDGVLNPAAARGTDGHLYLFPRLVAKGKLFAHRNRASAVQRSRRSGRSRALGIALEPEADYERRPDAAAAKIQLSRLWNRSGVT